MRVTFVIPVVLLFLTATSCKREAYLFEGKWINTNFVTFPDVFSIDFRGHRAFVTNSDNEILEVQLEIVSNELILKSPDGKLQHFTIGRLEASEFSLINTSGDKLIFRPYLSYVRQGQGVIDAYSLSYTSWYNSDDHSEIEFISDDRFLMLGLVQDSVQEFSIGEWEIFHMDSIDIIRMRLQAEMLFGIVEFTDSAMSLRSFSGAKAMRLSIKQRNVKEKRDAMEANLKGTWRVDGNTEISPYFSGFQFAKMGETRFFEAEGVNGKIYMGRRWRLNATGDIIILDEFENSRELLLIRHLEENLLIVNDGRSDFVYHREHSLDGR